jgi:hypothetical protein
VRVIINENLSPALARALNALFSGEHEIVHIRHKFGANVKDADWIGRLSAEGHRIVISGDASIARKKAEQAAFRFPRLCLPGGAAYCAPATISVAQKLNTNIMIM